MTVFYLLLALFVLRCLDAGTTYYGLKCCTGLKEANKLAKWEMDTFGMEVSMLFSIVIPFVAIYLLCLVGMNLQTLAVALWIGDTITAVAVAHSFYLLFRKRNPTDEIQK